ncbi:hypothetical protein JMJ77_0012856 [Colletotrichum scovillei]|uniref:Uncharacterized protein n=1 Tax=Colletotrichum scovillei TaxID=1209932 RepID=A0A9P7UEY0_9PEZI|nr:hypothetical protein JMJ77_0012856 [Colletotrichum scovillei]KAG7069140.1 hypothetical protein JMJ76_0002816 [Colletotrichum scovillei]KAG7073092.1 hypothetical protein JMJ78_0014073 [Colletotrichum scovillei]
MYTTIISTVCPTHCTILLVEAPLLTLEPPRHPDRSAGGPKRRTYRAFAPRDHVLVGVGMSEPTAYFLSLTCTFIFISCLGLASIPTIWKAKSPTL